MFVEVLHVTGVLTEGGGGFIVSRLLDTETWLLQSHSMDHHMLLYTGTWRTYLNLDPTGRLQETLSVCVRYLNCYKINVYLKYQLILEYYFHS